MGTPGTTTALFAQFSLVTGVAMATTASSSSTRSNKGAYTQKAQDTVKIPKQTMSNGSIYLAAFKKEYESDVIIRMNTRFLSD